MLCQYHITFLEISVARRGLNAGMKLQENLYLEWGGIIQLHIHTDSLVSLLAGRTTTLDLTLYSELFANQKYGPCSRPLLRMCKYLTCRLYLLWEGM